GDPLSLSSPDRHNLSPAVPGLGNGKPFSSEPMRDFSDRAQHRAFGAAVARAAVPRVANDTTVEGAGRMVQIAASVFKDWRATDPHRRARVLVRAAAAMRARRDELAGVMIKESGKTW